MASDRADDLHARIGSLTDYPSKRQLRLKVLDALFNIGTVRSRQLVNAENLICQHSQQ